MNKMNWKWTLVCVAALVGATVLLDAVAWAGKPVPPPPPLVNPTPIVYQIQFWCTPKGGSGGKNGTNRWGDSVGSYMLGDGTTVIGAYYHATLFHAPSVATPDTITAIGAALSDATLWAACQLSTRNNLALGTANGTDATGTTLSGGTLTLDGAFHVGGELAHGEGGAENFPIAATVSSSIPWIAKDRLEWGIAGILYAARRRCLPCWIAAGISAAMGSLFDAGPCRIRRGRRIVASGARNRCRVL